MKVAALCAYYAPEVFSDRYLIEDIFDELVKRGDTVIVYTPTPCRGISKETRREYRNKKQEILCEGKLIIKRFRLYAESSGTLSRAIRYIIQNIKMYFIGLNDESDILYAISTPPTQGLMSAWIKRKRKVPFIYGLQDIFPDSLISTGISKPNSLAWKVGKKIENATYKGADKIVVISEDFKSNLLQKNVPEEKIRIIPNWIDTDRIRPIPREKNKLFDELNIDRKDFYVVYAGDLGEAQGIDTLLEAAQMLEGIDDIKFIIFGDGSRRSKIEEQVRGRNNVKLFHLMPKERVPEVYSLGNVSVVSCKTGLGKAAMPSKTWSIMACARPVLLNFDKETNLWNLIHDNTCGFCTEAGNAESLCNGIKEAYSMEIEELDIIGLNGRNYVANHISRQVCVSEYCDLIEFFAKEEK